MKQAVVIALSLIHVGFAVNLPTQFYEREVPQEHSHENVLTVVRQSLAMNNPDQISDPVFGLLGNAAAAGGKGNIQDADCLQQATADQAFTNAKAANDVNGMTFALIYRALERNTGSVGLKSNLCTSIKAKNPEIAAITQHQDPASDGAAAANKAVALEVAKQIKSIGGDPTQAILSGTFKAGKIGDPTAKGNTCDDANDAAGCINSQNLLNPDVTAAEIDAAVGGAAAAAGGANGTVDAVAAAANGTVDAAAAAANGTVDAVAAAANGTVDAVAAAANGTVDAVAAAANGTVDAVAAAANGTVDAVAAAANGTVDAVAAAANGTVDAAACAAIGTVDAAAAAAGKEAAAQGAGKKAVEADKKAAEAGKKAQAAAAKKAQAAAKKAAEAAMKKVAEAAKKAAKAAEKAAGKGMNAATKGQVQVAAKAADAGKAQAAAAGGKSDLGTCTDATVKFGPGFDGRKEDSFIPNNTKDFTHGSALNIKVISDFICQQLNDKCKASAAAIAACKSGAAAAGALKGQASADAFNAAFK